MTTPSIPEIRGGTPDEWAGEVASRGAVAFAYRTIGPWLPLGIGVVIVWGCLDWFRTYWPPTDWRAGWVLTPLLCIVGLMFLAHAIRRFGAVDAPALVSGDGISGQKLALIPWDALQEVRWVYTKVNRGIYAVVSPEVYARQPAPATLWNRFARLVHARSWNPDERQLLWLERPVAASDDIIAFVHAEIARRAR